MKTTVSEKGQITIPKPLRDRLGIRAGQVLEAREERGRLVLQKAMGHDPFEHVTGILKSNKSTDELIEEMRGKPDGV